MTVEVNPELPPESPDQMCQLCQLPVQAGARATHERGLHHQAARQIAAAALDRWRAHMAGDAMLETLEEPLDTENHTFCDICTEAVPTTSYARHVTVRSHLISALDGQLFEELVRLYVDEEDLKLLEGPEQKDGGGGEPAINKSEGKFPILHTRVTFCALKVPSAFKSEHERSAHHRTRVALATAAARRTSAFLHETTIGVPGKRNIKMTELLKSYTGADLTNKTVEEVDEKEVEVEEKVSQSEVKKRLTAKQYFKDILPYLKYTEALYTLIIDDTEFVTIKNINGMYMRVHVANFNGVYSTSGDLKCDMRCRMCHGHNHYMSYSSELNHDKLHVMSLGHIRHVLTPIDNVHGIRQIDNGQSLCILCNFYMPHHNIENHIFNDIHHTANLAAALKLGRNFKESKDDLKIIIYSAPPVEKSNFMRHPVRNYDSVLNHRNNFPYTNGLFGGNVSFPDGGNSYPDGGICIPSKPQGGTLFGATSNQMTGFGASNNTASSAGVAPAVVGAKPANTLSFASTQPSTFGASNASPAAFGGTQPGSTSFKTASFGAQPAGSSLFGASNASNIGVSSANTLSFGGGFGSAPPSGSIFGASNASKNFVVTPAIDFSASSSNTGASSDAKRAKNGTTARITDSGTTFGGPPPEIGNFFDGVGNNTFGTTLPEATGGTPNSGNIFGGTVDNLPV